jgi:predicted HAD superfamily Cof-like phosphohydrolase
MAHTDMVQDIIDFHEKMGLKNVGPPDLGSIHYRAFRVNFLKEELKELEDALKEENMSEVFDALIDLTYVAMGTAYSMGFPWQEGWDEVHKCNMSKQRVQGADDSKRGTPLDVMKPADWKKPNLGQFIVKAFKEHYET